MCFNPAITWATATLGFATFVLAKAKGKPATLYVAPAYFALMEILQGFMYLQTFQSSVYAVNLLVYLAYLHVCFQPLVFNYWLGYFIRPADQAVLRFTLKLCFIGGLLLLSRVFFTDLSPLCSSYETLCSQTPAIFSGYYHIAWSLPLVGAGWDYVTPSIALHMFLFFVPGVLMGLYRLMILFFVFGPFLSSYITPNPSEQSSIWCIMGLWLLAITVLTSLNQPPRILFPKEQ